MPTENHSAGEAPPSTILVVEPDILVRMTIADYLRDCGYKVFEAATADDVMIVLGAQQTVDIVFAEVQLGGGMDGFGLAQWVRGSHPGTDVILTSGVGDAAEKAGDLCDEGPLHKPYEPREVARRINLLLERRRIAPKQPD
jgi:DNA-binding response OmpR family regulator